MNCVTNNQTKGATDYINSLEAYHFGGHLMIIETEAAKKLKS